MGTPVQGSDFLLKVGATIVEGINQYNKQRTRNTNFFPVFNRDTPWSITDPKEERYSVTGLYIPDDPGQDALRAAELSQDPVTISVLPDGTAGFSQEVIVSSHTHDASPEGFQEITFEFTAFADAVAVSGGDLL